MTVALWCVLIAFLLPYLCIGIAKAGGKYRLQDNHDPGIFSTRSKALPDVPSPRN